MKTDCKKCKGTGKRRKDEPCRVCQGSGKVIVTKTEQGTTITPAGQGGQG